MYIFSSSVILCLAVSDLMFNLMMEFLILTFYILSASYSFFFQTYLLIFDILSLVNFVTVPFIALNVTCIAILYSVCDDSNTCSS